MKDIPPEVRKAVYKRDNYRCRGCGTTNSLHLHHVIFRSQGGKHREDNLVTLCYRCHELAHKYRRYREYWEEWIKELYGGILNGKNYSQS